MNPAKFNVTKLELDEILKGFERVGSVDRIGEKLDTTLREYLSKKLEETIFAYNQKLDQKLASFSQTIDATINTQTNLKINSFNKEWEGKISAVEKKISNDISSSVLTILNQKLNEIRGTIQEYSLKTENKLSKEIESATYTNEKNLTANQKTYEELLTAKATKIAYDAVTSLETSVKQLVEGELSNQFKAIKDAFTLLRVEVMDQLSERIVDKNLIESRFKKLEQELSDKAQNTINFHIEQARANMEQSAKAELEHGISQAATKIFADFN